jgi:hypothetical protein
MATTTTRPNKISKPVVLQDLAVSQRPIYHCVLLPQGQAGIVSFNGGHYTVLPLGAGSRDGYRLVNIDSKKIYDVDTSTGHPTCDCPDFVARRGRTGPKDVCKHCLALMEMRKQHII